MHLQNKMFQKDGVKKIRKKSFYPIFKALSQIVLPLSRLVCVLTGLRYHGSRFFSTVLTWLIKYYLDCMRKPAFCICENKGTDQLRGHRAPLFSRHG